MQEPDLAFKFVGRILIRFFVVLKVGSGSGSSRRSDPYSDPGKTHPDPQP